MSGLVAIPEKYFQSVWQVLEWEFSRQFNSTQSEVSRSTCNSVCLPHFSSLLYYCWIKMKWAFRTAHMTLHNGLETKLEILNTVKHYSSIVVVSTGAHLMRTMKNVKKAFFKFTLRAKTCIYKYIYRQAQTFFLNITSSVGA